MADRSGRPRLLVVGNGPTGVGDDGSYHVDRSCGQLLDDVAEMTNVTFAQPVEPIGAALNYYGHILAPKRVTAVALDTANTAGKVLGVIRMLGATLRSDFVYLFYPGTLPRLIARFCHALRKPYGVFLRGGQFESRGVDAKIFRDAEFILSVSPALARQAAAFNRDVEVVRSARDLKVEDACHRAFSPRTPTPLRLLFVGRIESEKGVPELIEAAKRLHREGLIFELVLVGLGDLEQSLRADLARSPGLPITLTGAIEDRDGLMQTFEAADIFVLPTHHEGFPRVLYEAMLKSCAIITTMVGGIPAVMRDEENCLSVPVEDSDALARAVRRLADDPSLLRQLALGGLDTVTRVLGTVPTHSDALRSRLDTALPQ